MPTEPGSGNDFTTTSGKDWAMANLSFEAHRTETETLLIILDDKYCNSVGIKLKLFIKTILSLYIIV